MGGEAAGVLADVAGGVVAGGSDDGARPSPSLHAPRVSAATRPTAKRGGSAHMGDEGTSGDEPDEAALWTTASL